MAPTELLAEQHYRNFQTVLRRLELEPVWLTGHMRSGGAAAENAGTDTHGQARLVDRHPDALFQEDVGFANWRWSSSMNSTAFSEYTQRLALREKGASAEIHPHQLIMTATPIRAHPCHESAYADLDMSAIDRTASAAHAGEESAALSDTRRSEVMARVGMPVPKGAKRHGYVRSSRESDALGSARRRKTRPRRSPGIAGIEQDLRFGARDDAGPSRRNAP